MKGYGYKCSVINKSQDVVSSTSCNWARIRSGALINIDGCPEYHQINYAEPLVCSEDFTAKNRNTIVIKKNLNSYLLNNDTVDIIYNKLELDIGTIENPGVNYKVGELLIAKIDSSDENIVLKIVEVNKAGSVISFEIVNKGQYSEDFGGKIEFENSINGTGFVMLCRFRLKEAKGKLDRICLHIVSDNTSTMISFAHQLPADVKSGRIVFSKWKIQLAKPFYDPRGDFLNKSYKIFNDFTPHYGLPLMLPNQANIPEFVNNLIHKLDSIIHKIESNE